MYYPVITALVLLATGFAGLRLIPKPHRGLRQFAAGLSNLGFIMIVCCAVGWFFYTYWLEKLPEVVH